MVIILEKKFFIIIVLFVVSCTQTKDFEYGIKEINSTDIKYNTTLETYPKNIYQINLMISDLIELKKLKLDSGQEPFNNIIDYRILNLEAERLYIEGQKYGDLGTTKNGFCCKLRPFIIESVSFRNRSSLKGFEAVNLLREFMNSYSQYASLLSLSEKNVLFLNATFYDISREAKRDSDIINNFCPENATLEIYKQEFKRTTNFSKDYINSLDYENAVNVWKSIRGIK